MSENVSQSAEKAPERGATETTVRYEVWRTHLRGGPDVRIGHDLTLTRAFALHAECLDDRAEGYPAARLDFYLVKATTTRERVTSPGSADQ